ncbi:transposable element Tcb1 transposase [Trichonephila clavipes]|nr:transposable element Tcb1 transposase [Trichonephila clavipes]
MAKFSYLPENKRYKIIHLKEEGYYMRQIATKVTCGLSTVVRTSKRFSETNFIADRGRSGQPRKTSLREDSDESQFFISGNQSSAYVRRRTHEEFSPQCLKPTVKYPTKVMVWGCMSFHGVGRLHIVSGTVKALDYIEILQNKLLPTARDLLGNQSWIFQDDNTPCHRAKVVQKWLKDHTVNRMNWPGKSLDLNPIVVKN